jgi:uncharacterized Fe-S cluster protein YjdI
MNEKLLKYKSDYIEISYNPKTCIHAAECVKGLPEVFNPKRKLWVNADAASSDEIAAVIRKCPTGALKYRRLDSGANEEIPSESNIKVVENGPLYLRGNISIYNNEGEIQNEETRVALCRCGRSKIKPFCDNTHKEINFNG